MLLRNLPQAEQSAEQVAAPQHDAPTDQRVAALGSASSGKERRAPMMAGAVGWDDQATATVGKDIAQRSWGRLST